MTRMRGLLLTTAAAATAAAVWAGWGHEARAITCANCTQELSEVIRSAERLVQMKAQLDQMKATYESLAHGNNVLGTATSMLNGAVRAPGSSAGGLPGRLFGQGQSSGAGRFLDQNRYHEPQGDDFGAEEMRRRARVTANIQAEAQAGLEAVEERRRGLDDLLGQIDAQPDVQSSAALGNRIAVEQAFIENERDKVGRLQLMQASAAQVSQQRDDERARKDAEEWRDRARSAFEVQW